MKLLQVVLYNILLQYMKDKSAPPRSVSDQVHWEMIDLVLKQPHQLYKNIRLLVVQHLLY
jgi:hypothetical protein